MTAREFLIEHKRTTLFLYIIGLFGFYFNEFDLGSFIFAYLVYRDIYFAEEIFITLIITGILLTWSFLIFSLYLIYLYLDDQSKEKNKKFA